MKQSWFEMRDIQRRKLNNSVWIPLRAVKTLRKTGRYGYLGYIEEFHGTGSLAVPLDKKSAAEKLGWMDIGISHNHSGVFDHGKYTPAEVFEDYNGEFSGIHLVLSQYINSQEKTEWLLNQDFILTLKLMREGDIWLSPSEGYIEVVRLQRGDNGEPSLIEVRAEHLKDYLCALNLGLYITSFFSRNIIVDDASFIKWEGGTHRIKTAKDFWEGRVIEIHEGGEPYGEKMAVFHASRTDVDETDDIPDISGPPTDENIKSSSWEKSFEGRKLFRVIGELWKNEWISPSKLSLRIKGDKQPPYVFFIIDSEGTKENKATLIGCGRWLWFKPDLIMALAHRRGGFLKWYTKDTGSVGGSPDDGVHFGVNNIGLITVYAKDIALLPDWQQLLWSGYNISPEGGVSEELLASQVHAEPARTQAPEKYLKDGLELLNRFAQDHLKISIIREHSSVPEIMNRIHRFRAIDEAGLFALAKDVARITADNFDTVSMQTFVKPPNKNKWGSLKTLENLLTLKIDAKMSRSILGALVGVYELRHADAHLPSAKIEESLSLLDVDRNQNLILQGYQLLHSVVSSIYGVIEVLKNWNDISK